MASREALDRWLAETEWADVGGDGGDAMRCRPRQDGDAPDPVRIRQAVTAWSAFEAAMANFNAAVARPSEAGAPATGEPASGEPASGEPRHHDERHFPRQEDTPEGTCQRANGRLEEWAPPLLPTGRDAFTLEIELER